MLNSTARCNRDSKGEHGILGSSLPLPLWAAWAGEIMAVIGALELFAVETEKAVLLRRLRQRLEECRVVVIETGRASLLVFVCALAQHRHRLLQPLEPRRLQQRFD